MQNIAELSRGFNWVDILVFFFFLRMVFVSLKEGLAAEFFKILGTLCAVYLSLHLYHSLALYLHARSGNRAPAPAAALEIVSFVLLSAMGYGVFALVRMLAARLITAQINPVLNRWAGLVVGCARAFLVASLILVCLVLTRLAYFQDSVRYSLSGGSIVHAAPAAYSVLWHGIVSKFTYRDSINSQLFELLQSGQKKKK